jgi:hypothetical protein
MLMRAFTKQGNRAFGILEYVYAGSSQSHQNDSESSQKRIDVDGNIVICDLVLILHVQFVSC